MRKSIWHSPSLIYLMVTLPPNIKKVLSCLVISGIFSNVARANEEWKNVVWIRFESSEDLSSDSQEKDLVMVNTSDPSNITLEFQMPKDVMFNLEDSFDMKSWGTLRTTIGTGVKDQFAIEYNTATPNVRRFFRINTSVE